MKHPDEIAKVLLQLYHTEFSGKKEGRFQISRKDFLLLAKVAGSLTVNRVDEIAEACASVGLRLLEIQTGFAVIENRILTSFRKLPSKFSDQWAVVTPLIENKELDTEENS